jgi:ABC-type multidrug transport system fused ATPase/permease subunit
MMASGTLQNFIDSFSQLELQMNSIERVKEYSTMKVEAAYDQDMEEEEGGNRRLMVAPREWPARGRIEFMNIDARYRPELPKVLTNLNITVAACEKVGIVGRTGKSRLEYATVRFNFAPLMRRKN